jgi:hypothetical protein
MTWFLLTLGLSTSPARGRAGRWLDPVEVARAMGLALRGGHGSATQLLHAHTVPSPPWRPFPRESSLAILSSSVGRNLQPGSRWYGPSPQGGPWWLHSVDSLDSWALLQGCWERSGHFL